MAVLYSFPVRDAQFGAARALCAHQVIQSLKPDLASIAEAQLELTSRVSGSDAELRLARLIEDVLSGHKRISKRFAAVCRPLKMPQVWMAKLEAAGVNRSALLRYRFLEHGYFQPGVVVRSHAAFQDRASPANPKPLRRSPLIAAADRKGSPAVPS